MSTVSVVMVSYHTGPSLWLAIDSVLAEPECVELILVNNGNPPGVDVLLVARAGKTPRIKLISGQGNVGFAKACNLGAKSATGDYILLLNPDCMLPDGALARSLEHMRPYPQNTVAGCFLANPSGTEQRGGRRGLLNPFNAALETFGLSFMLPADQRLNLSQTKMPYAVHEVPAISGAFMLLTRDYYNKLRGMDEAYFLHMEDMDFCYRVNKSGGKIIVLPDVKVIHFRSTSEVPSSFVEKEKTKSFILYLKKHARDEASLFLTYVMSFAVKLRGLIKRFINAVNRVFEPPLLARQQVSRLVVLYSITRFEKREQTLTGKRVLVTGASGQLGLCVVAEMLARGAHVIAVTQYTKIPFVHENLAWVERDLDRDKKALEGAEVDIVIHTTSLKFLPKFLPALCDGGAKRVIAFSCAPLIEKAASKDKKDQVLAKSYEECEKKLLSTAAEKACDVTIFRPVAMYGVGLDGGITRQADIINRYAKLPLYFPGSGLRQPLHVRDAVDGIMNAISNNSTFGKVYPLGGSSTMSYRQMLEQVFSYLGKPPKFFGTKWLPPVLKALGFLYALKGINADTALQMNRQVTVDSSEAAQDFGFRARPFLEGNSGL